MITNKKLMQDMRPRIKQVAEFVREKKSAGKKLLVGFLALALIINFSSFFPAFSQHEGISLITKGVATEDSTHYIWANNSARITDIYDDSAYNDNYIFSPNGEYAMFYSFAQNFVPSGYNYDCCDGDGWLFLKHIPTGEITLVSRNINEQSVPHYEASYAQFSPSGEYIVFKSDADLIGDDYQFDARQIYLYNIAQDSIALISRNTTTGELNTDGFSDVFRFSPDSNYVLMSASQDDVLTDDDYEDSDWTENLFLYDIGQDELVLVSKNSNNEAANEGVWLFENSAKSNFSPNSDYIVFESQATNLTNDVYDGNYDNVFLYEISTGNITLISKNDDNEAVSDDNWAGNTAFSPDGQYAVFRSNADLTNDDFEGCENCGQVYIYHISSGTLTLASKNSDDEAADDDVYFDDDGIAQFSPDGEYLLFKFSAENLTGDDYGDSDGSSNLFLYELETGIITLVSKNGDDEAGNSYVGDWHYFSPDGEYIVFDSPSNNLTEDDYSESIAEDESNIFLYSLDSGEIILVSRNTDTNQAAEYSTYIVNGSEKPNFSPNSDFVIFTSYAENLTGDNYDTSTEDENLFLYDVLEDELILVSKNSEGEATNDYVKTWNFSFSPDGSDIAFQSGATNLTSDYYDSDYDSIFLYNISEQTLLNVSASNDGIYDSSYNPTFSPSGDLFFYSASCNLRSDFSSNGECAQVYRWDVSESELHPVSAMELQISAGDAAGGNNWWSIDGRHAFSPDEKYILFSSDATNLMPDDDGDGQEQVYLYDTQSKDLIRISQNDSGDEGNEDSYYGGFSPDGKFALFVSYASNLTGADYHGADYANIYLYEIESGDLILVSSDGESEAGDGNSGNNETPPAFSHDGKYVAFESSAENLTSDDYSDNDGSGNLFLYEIETGEITLVSKDSEGKPRDSGVDFDSFSPDSSMVVFSAYAGLTDNVDDYSENVSNNTFLYDINSAELRLVSRRTDNESNQAANESVWNTRFSPDGKYIVFHSWATNLTGHNYGGYSHFFLYDIEQDSVSLVANDGGGDAGNEHSMFLSFSPNGEYFAFSSEATNLTDDDYAGEYENIFLYEMETGEITLVSKSSSNQAANDPVGWTEDEWLFSPNSQYLAFYSGADNLVSQDTYGNTQSYLYHIPSQTLTLVSKNSDSGQAGFNSSYALLFTPDSETLILGSESDNLTDHNYDWLDGNCGNYFLYDISSEELTLATKGLSGSAGNDCSYGLRLSPNGSFFVFASSSTNLVAGDTNGEEDIFLYDFETDSIQRLSVDNDGNQANDESGDWMDPFFSPNGSFVVFDSFASNLVAPNLQTFGVSQLYLVRLGDFSVPDPNPTPRKRLRILASGGYMGGVPTTPYVLPQDCLNNYVFSPTTGLYCMNHNPSQNTLTPPLVFPEFIPAPPSSSDFAPIPPFTKNLRTGVTDPEVKLLQQFLNQRGFVLAIQGPGSPNEETDKFGAATRTALIKFQIFHNLTPDGIFGPKTRELANSLLGQ